ncbi:hypothetical protein EKO04_008053 [Ascochyta lentis]|uniref:Xylanolytic transcriptional activator regulatory domain-containing protein n=1 Tax=Ascochyta lentis TaxID=205686 RepID=A0A8H7MCF7_9PLEO|nr:hypothetical protein EKO04_008053 [Ascochyta lentis]
MIQDRLEVRLGRVEDALDKLVGKDKNLAWRKTEPTEIVCISSTTPPDQILTPMSILHSSKTFSSSQYTGLAQELVRVWPVQHDIDRICDLPASLSTHLNMLFQVPSPASQSPQLPSTQQMLQLPPPGSHPVLIAQKLLILGSLLQGALSVFPETLRDHYLQISLTVVDTASRLVTTNEDLTSSVEGIACIMMEAMIQNHAGKLHRAWITLRRAISIAQLIGLHRNQNLAPNRFIDPGTRSNSDADHMCLHMVQMDRYLSLTLGLPYSSLECPVTAAALKVQPLDRMGRLQCAIAERIMRREGEEYTKVPEIDALLRQASNEMPPQWWLIPSLDEFHRGGQYPLHEVMRICYQLSHYHLLIRLHLPCLVSGDNRHNHGKITIVHASREILSRFIAFRAWTPGAFYCRGIDYLAFIALTAMCIAHIEVRSHADASTTSFLAHTHASDRGLMECAHQILKDMKNDEIAAKLSIMMQHLLDVETDAATGVGYSAIVTNRDDTAAECGGEAVDKDDRLHIHVPYFGTIKFQRKARVATESGLERLLHPPDTAVPNAAEQLFPEWDEEWSQPLDGLDDDWTLQNINGSLFSSLFGGLDDGTVG